MIPYARQSVNSDDVAAVVEVLLSNFLTQGPAIPRFEQCVSEFCGGPYAVAVSSGTAALHIACRALGLHQGDLLWTSPISFVASANCALYCGADVGFVDIDPQTGNMCPKVLEKKLETLATLGGQLPKIVIPVHLAGQSCDMQRIHALGKRFGFKIIEDSSHAVGAEYLGQPVGCCEFSDATIFSFHPVKIITTGEGGMVLTRSEKVAARLRLLRSHGITRDFREMTKADAGPWYYEQIDLGYHYRLTDFQAALGVSQMGRLKEFIYRRRELAARYDRLLTGLPTSPLWQDPKGVSSFHLYIIRIPNTMTKVPCAHGSLHRVVFDQMRAAGIEVNLHYIPIPLQPYYQQLGYSAQDIPEALRYYSEAISLPLYYGLSDSNQDTVCKTLRAILTAGNLGR